MRAKEYNGDRPCIPFVWIMLDSLDKKGLLVPKLRPAVTMPQKKST